MNADMFIDIDFLNMQKHVKLNAISVETFCFHGTTLLTVERRLNRNVCGLTG